MQNLLKLFNCCCLQYAIIIHSVKTSSNMPGINMLRLFNWNVNGLGEKRHDPDFVNVLTRYDLVCLTETWSSVINKYKVTRI